jgi:hypothetical protein
MFDGLSLARTQSSGAGHPAAPAAQQPLPPQQGADSLFGGLALAGAHCKLPGVMRCSCHSVLSILLACAAQH